MEIYTAAQAAKILSVNERTIRRWLRSGELTGAETTVGWRLTPADLEAWLNRHRKVRQPEPVVDEDASDRAALALADTSDFEDWQTVKARNGL
jgi:excisionase family DNA binding protein